MKFVHILVLIVLTGIGYLWYGTINSGQSEQSAINDAINATKQAATDAVEATSNAIDSATESVPIPEQEPTLTTALVPAPIVEVVEVEEFSQDKPVASTEFVEQSSDSLHFDAVSSTLDIQGSTTQASYIEIQSINGVVDIESTATEIVPVVEEQVPTAEEQVPTAQRAVLITERTVPTAEKTALIAEKTAPIAQETGPFTVSESNTPIDVVPTTLNFGQAATTDSQTGDQGSEATQIEDFTPQIDLQLQQIDAATNAISDQVDVEGASDVINSTESQAAP